MAISSKLTTTYQKRSISLPSKSHPRAVKIEEELKKAKTGVAALPSLSTLPTAKTITNGLSILERLYKSMNDLLNSTITRQTLSHHQNERFVNELQDILMAVLEVSDTAREIVSQMTEHGRDIQSSLRRKNCNSDIKYSITNYSFRKKLTKDAKRLISTMKQKQSRVPMILELDDHNVSKVVGVTREVVFMSLDVLNWLLLFLSVPMWKPKPTMWTVVSKLLHKGAVASECQTENLNDLLTLDFQLLSICSGLNSETVETAQSSLKSLEVSIDAIENGLSCLFRGLIKARTSVLNIVSSQK